MTTQQKLGTLERPTEARHPYELTDIAISEVS